jgi:hypothetical protein
MIEYIYKDFILYNLYYILIKKNIFNMINNNKGASEVISYVLVIFVVIVLVGIIIGGIIPSVEKSSSINKFEESKKYILDIENKINQILISPIGSVASLSLDLSNLTLEIDSDTSKIEIYHLISGDYYKDGMLIDEGKTYTFREGQKIIAGLRLEEVEFTENLYVNKVNTEIYIKKVGRNKIQFLRDVDLTDVRKLDVSQRERPDSDVIGVVLEPLFSVDSGTYNSYFYLTLTEQTEGSIIRYTLNGSEPNINNGIIYESPIYIDNSVNVKAIAYKEGMKNSSVISKNYVIELLFLTVSKTGAGDGTITSSPSGINCGGTCSYGYEDETSVTLTAATSIGNIFTGWSGEGCSGTGTCTVTMTQARNVTANFDIDYCTLTSNNLPSAGGSISGAGSYQCGSAVTLTASPNTGYNFSKWTNSGGTQLSTNNPYTFTLSSSMTVNANYNYNEYTLTLLRDPSAGGSVSGAGNYEYQASVTAIATPETGYTFVNWTDGGDNVVSTDASYTFNMPSENKTLVANFEVDELLVSILSPENNSTFSYGEEINFLASVDNNTGEHTCSWTSSVDGNLTNASTYVSAEGGEVTDTQISGQWYRIHAFKDVGEDSFNVTQGGEVDVLVVAGGGGGGTNAAGGGGGAGGLIFSENKNLNIGLINVDVGSGGTISNNGENSQFDDIISIAGGAGGNYVAWNNGTPGNNGGSGGGGAGEFYNNKSGGTGTVNQGTNGGIGYKYLNNNYTSGGGGGKGASGDDSSNQKSGDGGDGIYLGNYFSNNYGVNGWFAGGGGGSVYLHSGTIGTQGFGGNGGGGDGRRYGNSISTTASTPGISNTGGGGGGLNSGGSGIVLVRYQIPYENYSSQDIDNCDINVSSLTSGEHTITLSVTDAVETKTIDVNITIEEPLYPQEYLDYLSLVSSDGGEVIDEDETLSMFEFLIDNGLYNNLVLGVSSSAGVKTRSSGEDLFIEKAYDFSGNNNHATQTTTTDQPKLDNLGMKFDGVNDYLNTPFAPVYDTGDEFSILVWFNTDATNQGRLIEARDSNKTGNPLITLLTNLNSSGEINFLVRGQDSIRRDIGVNINSNNGQWKQVVGVANGTTKIYFNQNLIGSNNDIVDMRIDLSNTPMPIGARNLENFPYDQFFDGKIDKMLIFNKALSSEEVISLYNHTKDKYSNISCKSILDHGNSTGDGIYLIDPDGPGGEDPFEVYCDMTTDGGGWMAVWKNFGGPENASFGSNVSNLTLWGNTSTYNSLVAPYFYSEEAKSAVHKKIWDQYINSSNVEWLKHGDGYDASGNPYAYTYNAGGEPPGGFLHPYKVKLDMGSSVSMNDIMTASDCQALNNQVTMFIYNSNYPDGYDYGSTDRVAVSSTSKGFASSSDPCSQPSSNLMDGWGSRHVLSYRHEYTGIDTLRCQFECWGTTPVMLEVIWFVREK